MTRERDVRGDSRGSRGRRCRGLGEVAILLLLLLAGSRPGRAAQPGEVLWSFQAPGALVGCPAVNTAGTLYIGCEDTNVYALRAATGQLSWAVPLGGAVGSSPAVGANGTVYVGCRDDKVYALDGVTGQKRWEVQTDGGGGAVCPAVAQDGTVYLVGYGRVYALDGVTGQKRWEMTTGGSVASPAVGADGTLYVQSAGRFYALQGTTGEARWQVASSMSDNSSPAIGADGTVYGSSLDAWVEARDGKTGEQRWRTGLGIQLYSSPAIGMDGTVYVGANGVEALDGVTGRVLWRSASTSYVVASPAIAADGTVYAGSQDGRLYALDGASGQTRWQFRLGGEVNASPAIGADGTVYVASAYGRLYALRGGAGLAPSSWPKFRGSAANEGRVREAAGPPRIVWQSPDSIGVEGRRLVLSVACDGALPLSYEWRLNGQVLEGITGARYEAAAFEAGLAGSYQVGVRNAAGVAESAAMTVAPGYPVVVQAIGSGRVDGVNDAGLYAAGSVLELRAVPAPGVSFVGWSGDASGTTDPLRLSVDRALQVVATFGFAPGTQRWEVTLEGEVNGTPAIGKNDTLYVADATGVLYALDSSDGQTRWTARIPAANSSPAIGADGTLYLGSGDHNVYALDGATGQTVWVAQTGGPVDSSPAIGVDGTVYVGSNDLKLHALAGENGQELWEFETRQAVASPAIGLDGTVYVGSDKVYALHGATGQRRWQFQPASFRADAPALGADGTVYAGAADGRIYALDGCTGQLRWVSPPGNGWSPVPAIGADGTLYLGPGWGEGKVCALDRATGEKRWEFRTWQSGSDWNNMFSTPAAAADGTVYAGAGDGRLWALDGATGQAIWEYQTDAAVQSSVAIGADGTVYVVSYDRKVHAVQGRSGLAPSSWPKARGDAENKGRGRAAPRVESQLPRAVLKEDEEGRIAVRVSGEPPPEVQWFFSGATLPGATNATLSFPRVTRALDGIYQLRASNALGQATSAPVAAVVSNVDPQGYPAWRWESAGEGLVVQESPRVTGPWAESVPLPPSVLSGLYVGTNALTRPRFYRLRGTAASRFTASFVASGWWYPDPAGTRHRIEYVWSGSGWTNWVELTELALPESPHLFLDTDAFDHPGAVYRTTPVP